MLTESLFDAFVPAIVRTRLTNTPSGTHGHWAELFPGALLFADISGFSTLAEQLSRRGPRGAEDLRDLLNLFFGRLVTLVYDHGGQVLDFPGDAVIAAWPVERGGAPMAAQRSARCALAAQEALRCDALAGRPSIEFRTGIGFGAVWAAHVGGVRDRWHLVVSGDPLAQAVRAARAAGEGEVVVSPDAWAWLEPHAVADASDRERILVRSIDSSDLPDESSEVLTPVASDEQLRRYVPACVQARIDAGQTDWLAEFRRLTVLFVNVGAFDCSAQDALDRLQRAAVVVQTVVNRYEGNIEHLLADDKGVVAVCGWGLALHAHADDAGRAARAAVDIRQQLQESGMQSSLGLATGDVFTGLRGNYRRCDFAMIGSIVNLAARLMQASQGDILSDAASFDAAKERCTFDMLPPVVAKGFARPVDVYRVVDVAGPGPAGIVGRVAERRALSERLARLSGEGRGSVVVLEGDAGIGKSCLLRDVVDRAVSQGVRVVLVTGDAIERSAPYHVWRSTLPSLLGLPHDGVERSRRVMELLETDVRLAAFAPLLNPVLGLSLEETEGSRAATPVGRALLTRELLVRLFRSAVGAQPIVLVLDDTHWFDSSSWALAEGIQHDAPHLMLVIATRPLPQEEEPQELRRFRGMDGTAVLRLDALSAGETRALVCQRLRCRVLEAAVERMMREKAEGHPFFTEELAHALRDRGLVRVEDGVCRFSSATAAGESFMLPNTVNVMVSSRIDQLTVAQQLTVKVASVLGRSFEASTLLAVYPIPIDEEEMEDHLDALTGRDLIRPVGDGPVHAFEFKHAITQEVAYGLLPFAQRRQLHSVVARWHEEQHHLDLAPFYSLLADHWGKAEVPERALFYRERAGEDAFSRYANEEAVRYFTEALATDEALGNDSDGEATIAIAGRRLTARDARRIHWLRRKGEATVNLGRWQEGWDVLDAALTAMGRGLPTTRLGWARLMAKELATQAVHLVWPRPPAYPQGPVTELLEEAVCAYQRIGNISYLTDRKASLVCGLLAALNLAERLRPPGELAMLYSSAGNIAALVPLHGLAKWYAARSRDVARRLGIPALTGRILGRTSILRVALGEWEACADLEEAMRIADLVGDPFQWEESAGIRARVAQLRGEFDLAIRLGGDIRTRAAASGTAAHEIWGLDGEAWGFFYLGRHADALDRATLGLANARRGDRIPILDLLGVTALVHLYRNEIDEAGEFADRISRDLQRSRPSHFAVLAMSAAAETYVGLAERQSRAKGVLIQEADRACRRIERYARINPPARARAWLWRGCVESLKGRPVAARSAWRRCLEESERFGLPYEAARARYENGRSLAASDPARHQLLDEAIAAFLSMRAEFEVQRGLRARSTSGR